MLAARAPASKTNRAARACRVRGSRNGNALARADCRLTPLVV